MRYPKTRFLIGRAVLKNLKESTLLTFFEVCTKLGLLADRDYTYNSMNNVIKFWNGSEVYLKDLFQYPSDPEFDSLGSTEFTAAFVDEASQITEKAKNVVSSRLRYRLDEYGLVPKMLFCTNPTKNFLYYDFYMRHREGTLPFYRKFVPALVGDNPFISKHYVEQLQKLDKTTKERLLYGNWNYDSDPSKLIEYEKIMDMFTNTAAESPHKYITCDVARFGDDKTTIWVWEGLKVVHFEEYSKQGTKATRLRLEDLERKYAVPRSNIMIDEDGVGGGIFDEMQGIKGFVNNSAAIVSLRAVEQKTNYANLKTQCYFKLAEYINTGKIAIGCVLPTESKKGLVEDLEQVRQKDIDKDGKLAVVPKDQVKERLGRSPDYSDGLMMRMYYEVRQFVVPSVAGAKIF